MQFDDAELVTRLKSGDMEALASLLNLFGDKLYDYIYYHSGDHHLAEDIVSETFTRVIEKIGGYVQGEVPFKNWIFRIAYNLLADHLRRVNRRKDVRLPSEEWDEEQGYEISRYRACLADPQDFTSQLGEREILQRAINDLPHDQRSVFVLRFVQGFELQQVCTILDKSLMSVKSLQYRALVSLRKVLDEQLPEVAETKLVSKKLNPKQANP